MALRANVVSTVSRCNGHSCARNKSYRPATRGRRCAHVSNHFRKSKQQDWAAGQEETVPPLEWKRKREIKYGLRRREGSKTAQGPDEWRRSKEAPFGSHEILWLVVEPEGADRSRINFTDGRLSILHRLASIPQRKREKEIEALLLCPRRHDVT